MLKMLNGAKDLLNACNDMEGNYNRRKLSRLNREDNNGIGVSTVYTTDLGYETALLDATGAHPVERYENVEEARVGHERWVKFAVEYENGEKVMKLGYPGLIDDFKIVLKRKL